MSREAIGKVRSVVNELIVVQGKEDGKDSPFLVKVILYPLNMKVLQSRQQLCLCRL